jgi:AraC-like DNA-binding protein
MSYHLGMRSLLMARRAMPAHRFSDCVRHTLQGDIPTATMGAEMSLSSHHQSSLASHSERFAELMAVDINPVGQVFRLARSQTAHQRSWDAYNGSGNVVAPVFFEHLQGDISAAAAAQAPVSGHDKSAHIKARKLHEGLLNSYKTGFDRRLRSNQTPASWAGQLKEMRVSVLARILGAGGLILELCEFFETFPHAKVQEAGIRLGVHPRTLERRMRDLGITAVMLKRACMLASATSDLLSSDRPLDEIARRHGYADGAHLSKAVSLATGGISASMCRSFLAP